MYISHPAVSTARASSGTPKELQKTRKNPFGRSIGLHQGIFKVLK